MERRSELREKANQSSCVEFSTSSSKPSRIFMIRDVAPKGIGILVRKASEVLEHLKVGKIMDMKITLSETPGKIENVQVEIMHITKHDQGRFEGNYHVGLSILGK